VRSSASGNHRFCVADGESKAERLDRELIELLNELRVLLPGVQVLFAFLLTAPFASGFEKVTEFQRVVYAVCLLAALAATACLVAPTTYHRIQWRQRDKEVMLRTANRLALLGSTFLALSMTGSILLVGDYLFARWVAVLATIVAAVGFGSLWYALPLARRARDTGD
jgi:predicted membrane channel-forming protein YqfA (hemolysin III family)